MDLSTITLRQCTLSFEGDTLMHVKDAHGVNMVTLSDHIELTDVVAHIRIGDEEKLMALSSNFEFESLSIDAIIDSLNTVLQRDHHFTVLHIGYIYKPKSSAGDIYQVGNNTVQIKIDETGEWLVMHCECPR